MSKVYFNHSLLEGASDPEVARLVVEIVELKNALGAVPLYVYEHFWSINIQSGSLRSFLTLRHNRDRAKVIILALMYNGPHFHDSPTAKEVTTKPKVSETGFGKKLLYICFNDRQGYVLSLAGEKILIHATYTVSGPEESLVVVNLVGIDRLQRQLLEQRVFHSIEEVFQEINRANPAIDILPNARKSARRHNFKGAYPDVYKAITALERELSLLLEGVTDRHRMERFVQETGFEISGESIEVLNNPRYRKHREFVIGSKGNVLFEWHIKIGSETRVHFFIDKEDKKIYIGHCGKHLPIPSYKS
jgi:hypothetical protein